LCLLFISYAKAQSVFVAIIAKRLCLLVQLAAGGWFWPAYSSGNFSMGLWLLFLPGGTGADSNEVPLSLSAEVMLDGFKEVFSGCYIGRYHGHQVGIVMNICNPQKGLSLHLVT
jgi:hypothetical protein